MNFFLALQNTYDHVEIGLFSCTPQLVHNCSIAKMEASKNLIPALEQLLKKEQLHLKDFPFVVVNQGPGPFTTLRTVIATANGLSFATGIPLIGVDALHAAQTEWHDPAYLITVFMFNAFAFDVYIVIEKHGKIIFKGYKNIDELLLLLKKETEIIRCIGNGATLYEEKIKGALGDLAYIPTPNPHYPSLLSIGLAGYAQWKAGNKGVQQLLPLYLKQHPIEKSPQ